MFGAIDGILILEYRGQCMCMPDIVGLYHSHWHVERGYSHILFTLIMPLNLFQLGAKSPVKCVSGHDVGNM